MKHLTSWFVMFVILLASCEREERLLVGKTYSFTDDACTPAQELSCSKWIEFKSEDRVNYLPYGDIVYEGNFKIKRSTLTVYRNGDNQKIFEFTLKKKRNELVEIPSGEIWVLQ